MSALVDDREDPGISTGLTRWGIPHSVARLDSADLVIESCDGRLIGIEHKRLSDLINCMQYRRLAGSQLREMRRTYDRTELVLEGMWRPDENGNLCVPRKTRDSRTEWVPYYYGGKGISFRQLDSFLYSQYECAGVPHWRTLTLGETIHLYVSRYHWWQKDYELHKSHDVIYSNDPTQQRRGAITLHQGEPNPVCMVAAQIPGIDAKAWDVGKHKGFMNPETGLPSPDLMCSASEQEWRQVAWTDRKGNVKHFGKESAKEIVAWLKGRMNQIDQRK